MNLEKYLELQNKEFEEFIYDSSKQILLAAETEEDLIDFYRRRGETVKKYKDDGQSFIAVTKNSEVHLFIKDSNRSYRSIFKDFLFDRFGVPKESIKSELNVDHVFNKARAKSYFIRMILLDEKVNKQWGRAYESVITKIENTIMSSKKRLVLLDYSLLLKVIGFDSPKKSQIKNDNDIIQISNAIKKKLDNKYPDNSIEKYSLEVFLRAELNLLKNKKWRNPTYLESKQLEYKLTAQNDTAEIHNIRETFHYLSLVSYEPIVDIFGDEIEIYGAELCNSGQIISRDIKDIIDHILNYLEYATEVLIRFIEKNRKLIEIKITTFKESFRDDDTYSYKFYIR
ncbi:hypothetical protein [Sporosarcina sp. G11-34]|uniref:hypothetical protein n=1 Tax=Sporosarcina sp. G11-34 TaxID=2849605 RepID=UPI0022A8D557|nr:hypothetical protein [Sporosarcina sp. G11-34]MCZ2258080.1 hypothetical protein [Sporosarcina sp. G11-34]